jgi:lipid-A-disaccharide synthase
MEKTICILAGEVSGDMYGAALVKAIKKRDKACVFFGMGSQKMKEEGVDIIYDMSSYSTIGFIEPLKNISKSVTSFTRLKSSIKQRKPDLVIAIDSQGINVPLLKIAKKEGLKTAYFISPQEWHWGTEKGGKSVINVTDHIIAIFEKEKKFYERCGGDVTFVGHPLFDLAIPKLDQDDFYHKIGHEKGDKILAIFPGSRKQEVLTVFPQLLKAAHMLLNRYPNIKIVVSVVAKTYELDITNIIKSEGVNVRVWKGRSVDLIAHSYLSFTSSGTITLEHAILKTPCIVGYHLHPITFWAAKKMLLKRKGRIPFMSILNEFYREKMCQTEFLQENLTPENVCKEACRILYSAESYSQYKEKTSLSPSEMDGKGAIDRAAEALLSRV